jgi:hypothetical protein
LSVNFYIFEISRTTGPISTRIGTNPPCKSGIKIVQMKDNVIRVIVIATE